MKRDDVFKAIDEERAYQEASAADDERPDMVPQLSVGDTLTAIQYNLAKANEAWYIGSVPHKEAMQYLRKIAALCVQAGEHHGMPRRY